jgi:uncharacterized protein (DUF305 family)
MLTARRTAPALLILPLALTTALSCRTGTTLIQPGAPGQESRTISATQAAAEAARPHTAADIKFMQGMIHHHAQALDMTALLATRTNSGDMKKLAQRIELSQQDEIKMMREWLAARGADVPGEHAHHAPGAPMMPGMLTAEQMARLSAAKGVEFDKLFLEYMIQHHAGALDMVKELFSAPGAGQEAEIFAFASDVDADQLIEIRRMSSMLKELQK